jgi:hypothetical protein
VQRLGERAGHYQYNAFLSRRDGEAVQALTADYPKRWHLEEFFNSHQALGWDRAGTQNLHIRYGHMSLSLLAQAVTISCGSAWGRRSRAGPATPWRPRS